MIEREQPGKPTMDSTKLVGLLILGVILSIAIWQDMVHRKIPNALVLLASAFALLWSTTAAGVGLGSALLGGLVAFLVFVIFYVIGAMGAGDVKLVSAVGMFLGPADVLGLCITVLMAGGVQSLIWALWKSRLQDVLRNTAQAMRNSAMRLVLGEWPDAQDFPSGRDSMPYALAIGVGTLAHALWKSAF